jgi:hypothetical protein
MLSFAVLAACGNQSAQFATANLTKPQPTRITRTQET